MLLICGSFAELFANYKTLWASFVQLAHPALKRFRNFKISEDDLIVEPAPLNEQVPKWMYMGGFVLSAFFTCLVLGLQYGQNVGVSILSIIFGFLFSFIGAESCGRTNIIPVTSIGNASQLVIGGITRGHYSTKEAQMLNITGGLVALGASEQSADMLGDLKTAHLLRASPRVQFYAQLCGALVSIFMSVGMYILFSEAYPCINDLSLVAHCSFSAPDVGAWRVIALAVTEPTLPVPKSSGYTSIVFGLLAVLVTIVKYRWVPVEKHAFVPNINAIGIAFILNSMLYSFAALTLSTFEILPESVSVSHHPLMCQRGRSSFLNSVAIQLHLPFEPS